ncbi:MAG: hypothetical protein E5Y15_08415 [Mesorhizobium sp.]|nr:MAG: hypothetical protein E5Y15_08415 [Mesorhizobium sp.]
MSPERELQLILAGAQWLRDTPKSQRPQPAIVELRERYGLNAAQAILAIRYSTDFQSTGVVSNDNQPCA